VFAHFFLAATGAAGTTFLAVAPFTDSSSPQLHDEPSVTSSGSVLTV
jgi:hypothetical protein